MSYNSLGVGERYLLELNTFPVQDDFWKTKATLSSLHDVVRVPPAAQSGIITSDCQQLFGRTD